MSGYNPAAVRATLSGPEGATDLLNGPEGPPERTISDPNELTPIHLVADRLWFKRDDLFEFAGARGSKARAALKLLKGASGCTVAGNRHSPMVSRVARIAQALGVPCRCHTAGSKDLSPAERDAQAHGAELVKGGAQYLTALVSQAKKDAEGRGWRFMPLGMESEEYIAETRRQTRSLRQFDQPNPPQAPVPKRIVIPVGTGLALAGVLAGLSDIGWPLPVLGVVVGMNPEKYLDKWWPGWKEQTTLTPAASDFRVAAPAHTWYGVRLDSHYEAKAAPFLEPGDLLWCVASASQAERDMQEAEQ